MSETAEAVVDGLQAQAITQKYQIINAADWLEREPEVPDQMLENIFDAGDKVAIIGSSKQRKSFFALQLACCLASGNDFLYWGVSRQRSVLLIQLEVKAAHYHKRLRWMVAATCCDIGDRLHILNGRGIDLDLKEIEKMIRTKQIKADVIIVDPFYKLVTGDENKAQDVKPLLKQLDRIAESTGAAIIYTHHDPKGNASGRDIRDRGAGSNVLSRDYDACITLTPHCNGPEHVIVGLLLRNYPPQDDVVIGWQEGRFLEEPELPAIAAKPAGRTNQTSSLPPREYLPDLERLLGSKVLPKGVVVENLRAQIGLTRDKAKAVIDLAESEGVITRHDKSFPRKVMIGLPGEIDRHIEEEKNPTLFDDSGKL